MKLPILLFISILSFGVSLSAKEEKKLWELTPNEFFETEAVKQKINLKSPDNYLLSIAIFQATNALRKEKKLPLFIPNRKLHFAGAKHIIEMRRYDFFGHVNPYNVAEQDMATRIKNQGGDFSIMAENLALLPSFDAKGDQYQYRKHGRRYRFFNLDGTVLKKHSYESFAKEVVREWYKSIGHRHNLLDEDLTHIGIAVYIEKFDYRSFQLPDVYALQEFGGY